LARKNKKETLGNYIRKIGYIDVYQKFSFNKDKKAETSSFRLVHAKHVLLDNIKSFTIAKEKAAEMVTNKVKYEKHNKS